MRVTLDLTSTYTNTVAIAECDQKKVSEVKILGGRDNLSKSEHSATSELGERPI